MAPFKFKFFRLWWICVLLVAIYICFFHSTTANSGRQKEINFQRMNNHITANKASALNFPAQPIPLIGNRQTEACEQYRSGDPEFIIIGAPKTGTTALRLLLLLHSQLVSSPKFELHFFTYGEGKMLQNATERLTRYRRLFPQRICSDKILFEKSPSYFMMDNPGLITEMYPRMKFVLLVREPVTRLLSRFSWFKFINYTTPERFEDFVYKKDTNLSLNDSTSINAKNTLVREGFYAEHLKRWKRFISDDQLLIIEYENLKSNPETELNRLETFIGVDHEIAAQLTYDPRTGFYSNERLSSRSGGNAGPPFGVANVHRPVGVYPFASVDVRTALEQLYRPDTERFCRITHADYSWCVSRM